jgi:chromosome segregation ATPase
MVDSKLKSSKSSSASTDSALITVQDLNNILEVNQKALTIYLEVEKQNEELIERIVDNRSLNERLRDMLTSVDDAMKEQGHSNEIDHKLAADLLGQLMSAIRENRREIETNRAVGEKIREGIFSVEKSIASFENHLDSIHDEHGVERIELKKLWDGVDELKKSLISVLDHQKKLHQLIEVNTTTITDVKSKTTEVDKNFFRLMIILGSAGIGTIIQVVFTFLHK